MDTKTNTLHAEPALSTQPLLPKLAATPLRSVVGGVLMAFAVAGPGVAHAATTPLVRTLEDVAGAEVRTSAASHWVALTTSSAMPSLSEVRSGDRPVRLGLRNGAIVVLSPHSNLAVMGALDVDLGTRDGKSSATSLDLRAGEASLEVPSAAAPRSVLLAHDEAYILAMPGASARVRTVGGRDGGGARFAVVSDAGDVRVATTGAWLKMPVRTALDLRPKVRLPTPLPLPAPPTWKIDDGAAPQGLLAVVTGDAKAQLGVQWTPTPEAHGYMVEIARDGAPREIVARGEVAATVTSFATPPLAAGRYVAQVRSTGLAGFPGSASADRALRVVLVELPPGAVERDGQWSMPLQRPAKLADRTGLELALGDKGFLPAPAQFSLRTEEPTLFQLRLRGERRVVAVPVAMRELVAAIELSPKRAVWPTDAIIITVRVRESGRDAIGLEPKLRVTVGLDEVGVTWHHEGALWQGRLAPRHEYGPCVVRVTASDPWGNEIGRAFIEVESAGGAVATR